MTNETVINELGWAIIKLKAGRYEETYNILTDLKDEMTKKELNTSAGNENA